ncbi:MAG: hypothetical protein AAGH79_01820 [Bacteroidota bacterium]
MNYTKYLIIMLLSVVVVVGLQAQTDSLYLIARPNGQEITLRWAPNNYQAWSAMRSSGVVVERRALGSKKFLPISMQPIFPQSLEALKVHPENENPLIVAAAQAMYGEAAFGSESVGPMGQALRQYEAQQERFMLAMWAADLSATAAEVLGLRFVDPYPKKGYPYEYRVRVADEQTTVAMSPPVQLRSTDRYALNPVADFSVVEEDHRVILQWDYWANRDQFTAYYLEVAEAGSKDFKRIDELPFIPSRDRQKEGKYAYTIDLEANYQPRTYRIVGIDAFGENASPSTSILAQGIDLTPPPAAQSLQASPQMDNQKMEITWEASNIPGDQAGFVVLKASKYEGPYKAMHTSVLPNFTRQFMDRAPDPYFANYYAVVSVDTAGNTLRSPIAVGQMKNVTPPAQPEGLTGRIDSTGAVFLLWEPGEERDLLGYRVFTSNAPNREFLQVTDTIVRGNFFFDRTPVKTLTETVYFKIMAVDHNYNTSAYSEVIAINRPDKVAPSSPSIKSVQMRADGVWLTWVPSPSKDVQGQEIWRQEEGQEWTFLQLIPDAVTQKYFDKAVKPNTHYRYRILAKDDAGLSSVSAFEPRVYTGNYREQEQVVGIQARRIGQTNSYEIEWSYGQSGDFEFLLLRSLDGQAFRSVDRLPGNLRQIMDEPNTPPSQKIEYAIQVIHPDGSRSAISSPATINLN